MRELGFRDMVYQPWHHATSGGLVHYPAYVYLRGNYRTLTCVPTPGEETGKETFPKVPTRRDDGELAPAPDWADYTAVMGLMGHEAAVAAFETELVEVSELAWTPGPPIADPDENSRRSAL